jgi:hypothetical protein
MSDPKIIGDLDHVIIQARQSYISALELEMFGVGLIVLFVSGDAPLSKD